LSLFKALVVCPCKLSTSSLHHRAILSVTSFALQFAVAMGATVILTSSSDEKLALGRLYGAKYTINYKSTPDWEKKVMKITEGRGVDHTVEVGGPGTFGKSLEVTRIGGWIHAIGVLDPVSSLFCQSSAW
jgi:NADPH:quinone reductase-like Zn-dependent oxidoreductase